MADSVDGVEDLSSILDEDDTCPLVLLWQTVGEVEDLSSIPNKDDTCLAVLLWQTL